MFFNMVDTAMSEEDVRKHAVIKRKRKYLRNLVYTIGYEWSLYERYSNKQLCDADKRDYLIHRRPSRARLLAKLDRYDQRARTGR
jgi:hypothetical protein